MAVNGKAKSKKKSGSAGGRWFRRIVTWSIGLAVLGAIGLAIAVWFTMNSLPSFAMLKASEHGQTIVVRSADGTEIVSIGPSYGRWMDYEEIPPIMREAMLAVEDRRYFSHYGVDPVGVARSVKVRMETGRFTQGGSTITQQLARNIFLNNSKTLDRKLREALLAIALERKFSKEQILELYLNKVYFGGGAYGIDSASRLFFSHPANELSVEEAAIIAGLVKAPSRYSPTADANAAVARAGTVLRLMQETGVISASQAARVDLDDVKLKPESGQNSVRYFTDWALPQLDILLPETFEPIEVWTTLDVGMQRAATTAVKRNAPSGAQGALVSVDRDGAILAMVGGTDYVESNYNRATQALRQPGSAWKLFVYLAALEAGFTPETRVTDKPVKIGDWSPRNSGGSYAGEIDVRTAFAYSKNTVAAQIGSEVGFGTVASMARRFGITTPISTYPSMVLGSSEVRLIDMVSAFAAISAKGNSTTPYAITKVVTASGETIYTRPPSTEQLLVAPYVAAGITDLLQTAVNIGTGRAAQIGRPVAGKTGTTSSNKDGWFLGFSSGITTGVWMGRDDAKRVGGLQGGTAPARAFADYMRFATAKRPVEEFDTELALPEWQLEPDDEAWFGDPDDYYFYDEDGNLIDPYAVDGAGNFEFPGRPGQDGRAQDDGRRPYDDPYERAPRYREDDMRPSGPPSAAGDDFLDRATGRDAVTTSGPANPRETPRATPTPRSSPTIRSLPDSRRPEGEGGPRTIEVPEILRERDGE